MKLQNAIAISLVVTCAAACGDDDDNSSASTNAVYADDGLTTTDWNSAAVYAATDPLANPFFLAQRVGSSGDDSTTATTTTPTQAAQLAGDAANQYFTPASCVSATTSATQVTYDLTSCQGPLGLHDVSGKLVVDFLAPDEVHVGDSMLDAGRSTLDAGSAQLNQIGFTITSNGLSVDGAAASLNSQGIYSRTSAGAKQVNLNSNSNHSRNGTRVTSSSSSTLQWQQGSQCVNVDSNGKLLASSNTFDFTLKNYLRCTHACPKSGSVRVANSDQTVTVTLNGSDAPPYRSTNGKTGTVMLDCTK